VEAQHPGEHSSGDGVLYAAYTFTLNVSRDL
jgi:hypothetical protein